MDEEMELKMNEYQLPEKISFNYEELKQELVNKVEMYTNLVYTEEQIGDAKKDKASLNKLKKALNDERIRLQKEYMEPFNVFKVQIDEIISIIDKPVLLIDKQVKEYEEKQKQEKREQIQVEFDAMGFPEFVTLETIFDSKWLNASTSMKKIQEAMNVKKVSIEYDLETLQKLPEFSFEAVEMYKTTLDVHTAIAEASRMTEIAKKKEEAEKQVEAESVQVAFVAPPVDEGMAEENVEPVEQEEKLWKYFNICLSDSDYTALCDFLNSRKIEYKQI